MALRATTICLGLFIGANSANAELQSLFPASSTPNRALFTPDRARGVDYQPSSGLFVGTNAGGFFAPLPQRSGTVTHSSQAGVAPVSELLTLIASAEAGAAGYDAVQHGARVRPPRHPTQMTLGEIFDWIEATPGQPHAIGRYQFIPSTLRRLARIHGMGPDTRFSPAVQDKLAITLLEDAGLSQFEANALGRERFMHNLARIWAGLPLPNGRSYYDGYAGNRASMTWAAFEGGMVRIWGG